MPRKHAGYHTKNDNVSTPIQITTAIVRYAVVKLRIITTIFRIATDEFRITAATVRILGSAIRNIAVMFRIDAAVIDT